MLSLPLQTFCIFAYRRSIKETMKVIDRSNLWYNGAINLAKRKFRKPEKTLSGINAIGAELSLLDYGVKTIRHYQTKKKRYYRCCIEACGFDKKKVTKGNQ